MHEGIDATIESFHSIESRERHIIVGDVYELHAI